MRGLVLFESAVAVDGWRGKGWGGGVVWRQREGTTDKGKNSCRERPGEMAHGKVGRRRGAKKPSMAAVSE